MMDANEPMQSSPSFQNRNQSFGTGMNGDQGEPPIPAGSPAPGLPPSLVQRQQQMNPGPARVRLSGSMNGMSESMYRGTIGGMFSTQNGQADSTYATKKYFEPRQQ